MKKIFSSSIVLLVCLFFIFSYSSSHISLLHSNSITPYSVQALNSIASNDDLDSYSPDSQFTNYFYGLQDYAYNSTGTCGYVAIQIMLSYFNHCWNDDIIPENFETSATENYTTGVRTPGTTNAFHDLLLSIGTNAGYSSALTADTGFVTVINNYLNTYSADSATNWFVSSFYHHNPLDYYPNSNFTYSQYYANNIRQLVENDVPVIVYIHETVNGETLSHAAVAFDFISQNERLVFKTGWHNADISTLEREDNCIVGYVALLNAKSKHKHSYNFMFNNSQTCACGLPDHTHKITYTSKGVSSHLCSCHCGYEEHKSHRFVVKNNRFYTCLDCGFSKPYDGGVIPSPLVLRYMEVPFE